MDVEVTDAIAGVNVQEAVAAAVTAYINALPIGTALTWSRLMQLAYAASPAVTNVINVQLNGSESDVDPGIASVVKAGGVTVS